MSSATVYKLVFAALRDLIINFFDGKTTPSFTITSDIQIALLIIILQGTTTFTDECADACYALFKEFV